MGNYFNILFKSFTYFINQIKSAKEIGIIIGLKIGVFGILKSTYSDKKKTQRYQKSKFQNLEQKKSVPKLEKLIQIEIDKYWNFLYDIKP